MTDTDQRRQDGESDAAFLAYMAAVADGSRALTLGEVDETAWIVPKRHLERLIALARTGARLASQPAQGNEEESGPQLLERLGDNASKWAAEFRRVAVALGYSDMDEGWLIGWFANAIERSTDVRRPHQEGGDQTEKSVPGDTSEVGAGANGGSAPAPLPDADVPGRRERLGKMYSELREAWRGHGAHREEGSFCADLARWSDEILEMYRAALVASTAPSDGLHGCVAWQRKETESAPWKEVYLPGDPQPVTGSYRPLFAHSAPSDGDRADGWRPAATAPFTPHCEKLQYLLVTNGKHVGVGVRMESDYPGEPEWFDEHTEFIPDVTHWRPLPPPPEPQR